MYNEQIKEILMNTYDVCAYTLDFDSSVIRRNKLYFYTLDENYKKEIKLLRNILDDQLSKEEKSNLNGLMQLLPGDKRKLPQCACYTEINDFWYLTFYHIKGIRYHKSFGNHIAATLILSNIPVIELSETEKDTFFGYWNETYYKKARYDDKPQAVTKGINYRVNRNLLDNVYFRMFTSKFFLMVANNEKKYILKDISKAINECGCFLPSVPLSKILECNTLSEFFSLASPEIGCTNIDFNKIDMNVGYVIAKLLPFSRERNFTSLLNLTPETVRKCIDLKNLFDGMNTAESIKRFISNYYMHEHDLSKLKDL